MGEVVAIDGCGFARFFFIRIVQVTIHTFQANGDRSEQSR